MGMPSSLGAGGAAVPSAATRGSCMWKTRSRPRTRADGSARGRGRTVRCMSISSIAGGGPAALEGALAVQRLAGERVPITLLSDRDEFVYRPVAVAEPFGFAAAAALLARPARRRARLRAPARAPRGRRAGRHRVRARPDGRASPTTRCCSRSARAPRRRSPARSRSAGPRTARACAPRSSSLHAGEPLRVAFVAGAGDRVDAAALRARADDRALGGRARARARAVAGHLGAPAADDLRRAGRGRRRRAARRRRRAAVDRRVRRVRSRTAGCGSAWRAASRSTSRSRCRAWSARRSPACPPTRTASCPVDALRPRAGPAGRLRRRRHDHAPAQAGRPGHPAGRRRRRRDRRRRRRARRRRGLPPGAARDAADRRAPALPAPRPRGRARRRRRRGAVVAAAQDRRAASSRPTSPPTPNCWSNPLRS